MCWGKLHLPKHIGNNCYICHPRSLLENTNHVYRLSLLLLSNRCVLFPALHHNTRFIYVRSYFSMYLSTFPELLYENKIKTEYIIYYGSSQIRTNKVSTITITTRCIWIDMPFIGMLSTVYYILQYIIVTTKDCFFPIRNTHLCKRLVCYRLETQLAVLSWNEFLAVVRLYCNILFSSEHCLSRVV